MSELDNALALLQNDVITSDQTRIIDRALCLAQCNDISIEAAPDVIDYIDRHLFHNRDDLDLETKHRLHDLHSALQLRSTRS